MPKVHIIIPSIGDSHFLEKVGILDRNLARIRQFARSAGSYVSSGNESLESADIELSIRIFLYTPNSLYLKMLLDVITPHIPMNRVITHEEPGYLGEFIYRYIQPAKMLEYDYLFFLLDDVELSENFYLDRWIQCYHEHHLDILSPVIQRQCRSHSIMHQPEWAFNENSRGREISIVNMCEFFSYFMTPTVYYRYYTLFNEYTKSTWGIDLSMYHAGLRMGLHNKVSLNHYYSGSIGSNYCWGEMDRVLKSRQHIDLSQQRILAYEPCNLFYFSENIEEMWD